MPIRIGAWHISPGSPETHPDGFRKGIVIRHNFIYSTGRCAIGFSGDGAVCSDNVIRFARDIWRPTATGRDLTNGSSTNDNRLADNAGTLPAVFVASNRTNDAFPTRNVKVTDNTVGGQGILIDGSKDSADNLIKGNKTAGPCYAKSGEYVITNQANAKVEDNQGFAKVDDSPWLSQNERKAAGRKKKK